MKVGTKSTRLSEIKREWHLIDVKGKILGRTITEIAGLLMGKSKPNYVANLDCGDYVVIVNSADIVITGKKAAQKQYQNYSGYPGGLKSKSYNQIMVENPTRIITEAVAGMLPKNKLRSLLLKRLYVYTNDTHPYKAKFSKTV